MPEFEVSIPPQFVPREKPFNPRDPQFSSDYIEVRDETERRTRFIQRTSLEFRENFIDYFDTIQVITEDSTPQNDFFRIYFANGKSRKFNLKEILPSYIPNLKYGRSVRLFFRPDYYVKQKDGLIYPYWNGKPLYDFKSTPWLVFWRTKIEVLREIFLYQEAIASFAGLISASAGMIALSNSVINAPAQRGYSFTPRNSKVNLEKMQHHTYMEEQRINRLGKDLRTGRPTASLLSAKYSQRIYYPEVYLKALASINAGKGKLDRNGDMRVILFMGEHTGWVNNRPVQSLEVIFSDKGWHFYPQNP